MKILRYPLWTLLILFLVLIAGVGFVLSTQTGLNALLALAPRVLPGTLTYERIEGRLLGELYIKNLHYRDGGGLEVRLSEGRLEWFPSELLSRRLHIGLLQTQGLEVNLPEKPAEPPPPKEPFQLTDIRLPLQIRIDQLAVLDTRIRPPGVEDKPVVVDSVTLQADTQDQTAQLARLEVKLPEGGLALSGRLTPIGAYPLEARLSGEFRHPRYGPLTVQGTVGGELKNRLNIALETDGIVSVRLDGEASQVLTAPAWSGALTVAVPNPGLFAPELAGGKLSGQVQTQGSREDYRVSGQATATGLPQVGTVTARWQVSGGTQAVRVDELQLRAADHPLSLTAKGTVDLAKQTVDASGEWQALAWPLTGKPQVESSKGKFTLKGTLQEYRLILGAALAGPELGRLDLALQAAGGDQGVNISELSLRDPAGKAALTTQAEVTFAGPAFKVNGRWQELAWPRVGEPQVRSPAGQFMAQGTPQDYRAQLQADLTSSQSGDIKAQVEVAGTDQAVTVSEISLRAPDGKLTLEAQGKVQLADLTFSASGRWQSLAWPLLGAPQVESPKGTFQASGSARDYRFSLSTQVQGPAIPKSDWRLEGQGSDQALKTATLDGKVLAGEIRLTGSAAWKPAVRWQAELTGSGLDPGVQWPGAQGKLAVKLQTQGSLEKTLAATVDLQDLSGSLSGQPVQGNARVGIQDRDIAIDALRLRAGNAQLDASGRLAERWDMRWTLKVPNLNRLVKTATGAIDGSGRLQGTREKPQAGLDLTVRTLAYGDTQLQRLQAKAELDLSGATRSRLDVDGGGLRLAGQEWKTLSLKGAGTPAEHSLQAGLNGEPGRFTLALAGSFNLETQTWQGRLTQLTAQQTALGDWRLADALAIQASKEQAKVERGCLVSAPTRLCIQGGWSAKGGAQGALDLERFDLQRLARLSPGADFKTDTRLSGTVSGARRPDGGLQGKVDLALSGGSLNLTADGNPVRIAVSGGKLQGQSDGRTANALLALDLGTTGRLGADVRVRDLAGQPQINGTVNANVRDLSLASTFAPQVQNVKGQLVADLTLSGPLATPRISGSARLENGAAEVPETAIRIQDIQLAAVSTGGDTLQLSGSARSGPGTLRLDGRLETAQGRLALTIRGERFQVADSPDLRALISPDLNLAVDPKQIRIEGQVAIPEAYIRPPNAQQNDTAARVSASSDVVIVNRPGGKAAGPAKPAEPAGGPDLYAKVRVILGDARVEAFGFKGNLEGDLVVEQTPRLAPRGSGSVAVEAGEYRIYGQDIKIERGRVLFSGGPIDNPGLDLRVARTVDEVTAGAQVTGTLKNPQLTLFSDPAMPDASKLSYLIFGRAPSGDTEENAALYNAAAGLGFGGGNLVTGRISKAVGLDTLEFETGASPQAASLVMGKYLTPKLYVSYGLGLFEAVNTFKLRYDLTKRLELEASSSAQDTGGDIFYTVELP